MSAPMSARGNAAATAAAFNMMPGRDGRMTPRNPLLIRDEVGKAKPSCFDLPNERFAYGRPGNHDQEGAREVSMYWVNHKPSPTRENPAPDFVWFNKQAASARVTTARDLAFYRKEHDSLTPRYGVTARGPRSRAIPSDVMASFTYGKKVRPSTPIDEVISHRFAEEAEDELMRCYADYREENEKSSARVRKIKGTTASRGNASQTRKAYHEPEQAPEENFKINKFKDIPTKINNGRQKAAHTELLNQLMKDATERGMSDAGPEASEAGASEVPRSSRGATPLGGVRRTPLGSRGGTPRRSPLPPPTPTGGY